MAVDSGRFLPLAAAALVGSLACGGDDAPPPPDPWVLDSASFVVAGVVNGHPDLFLVRNRFDTAWLRLTAREGLDNSPTWSRDGTEIVFHSDRSAAGVPDLDLFMIEPGSGKQALQLTHTPGFDYNAKVSPDGRHISFLSRRAEPDWPEGSPGHIYIMNADGTNTRRVTRVPIAASLPATWMPDGRSLLVGRRTEENGPTTLSRVYLNFAVPNGTPLGSREEVLVADAFFNYTPAPSPDGRLLAYSAEGGGAARLVVMNTDGSDRKVLIEEGFNYVSEWTPDGRWIVVTRWYPAFQRSDAWLISADRSEPDQPLLSPVHRASSSAAFRPRGR